MTIHNWVSECYSHETLAVNLRELRQWQLLNEISASEPLLRFKWLRISFFDLLIIHRYRFKLRKCFLDSLVLGQLVLSIYNF